MSITSSSFLETKELLAQSPHLPLQPAKIGSAFLYKSIGMKITERFWFLIGLANACFLLYVVFNTVTGTGLRMFGL